MLISRDAVLSLTGSMKEQALYHRDDCAGTWRLEIGTTAENLDVTKMNADSQANHMRRALGQAAILAAICTALSPSESLIVPVSRTVRPSSKPLTRTSPNPTKQVLSTVEC